MYVFAGVLRFALLFSASLFILGQAVQAAELPEMATTNLDVTLEMTSGCSIGFGSGAGGDSGSVKFPPIVNLDKQQIETININIQCSQGSGIHYTLGINSGLHSDGDYKKRRLQAKDGDTDHYIGYNVYKDAACSQLWGPLDSPDVMGPIHYSDKEMETYPVCIKILAQPKVALYPGIYTDTVTAEISY